ncbi:MAG: hypothetical protein AB2825_20420 [Candidatus Thiodiazotropha endolucinida]
MSIHTFTTMLGDDEIVVTMGWDRPLQGFFMTITRINPKSSGEADVEDEEHFLFNNLEQQISHPKGIEAYLFELEHRGIEVPEKMINEVLADGMHNVGNKIVEHTRVKGIYKREQTL